MTSIVIAEMLRFARTLAFVSLMYAGYAAFAYLVERKLGHPATHYLSRVHLRQFAWYLFRQSGVATLLLFSWTSNALKPHLSILDLNLTEGFSVPARFLLVFLVNDLVFYWVHRMRHAIPFLWPFHATHHACELMTPAASDQIHPVDDVFTDICLMMSTLMIGGEPGVWLGVKLSRTFIVQMQHTEIDWRFGPLYRVFVSPVFHRVHHARDTELRDKNFGAILSVWDYLFGTAVNPAVLPTRYGVENLPMPTITSQLLSPFRTLYNESFRKGQPLSNLAPEDSGTPRSQG